MDNLPSQPPANPSDNMKPNLEANNNVIKNIFRTSGHSKFIPRTPNSAGGYRQLPYCFGLMDFVFQGGRAGQGSCRNTDLALIDIVYLSSLKLQRSVPVKGNTTSGILRHYCLSGKVMAMRGYSFNINTLVWYLRSRWKIARFIETLQSTDLASWLWRGQKACILELQTVMNCIQSQFVPQYFFSKLFQKKF